MIIGLTAKVCFICTMKDIVTKVLRGRKVFLGRDFYQGRQIRRSRMDYGNRFANWTFCPDLIDENALVYSFGVGADVSFDLELIKNFKLHVYAFDPSPGSIEWVEKQQLPEEFHFYPYGLAAYDGNIQFAEPHETGVHSLRMIHADGDSIGETKIHELPVHRLSTLMQKLGHSRIDILKMDIEGAEYKVVEDILEADFEISQILIEFHHRFSNMGIEKTRQSIRKLNSAGYKIFNVSASGEEISFIHSSV